MAKNKTGKTGKKGKEGKKGKKTNSRNAPNNNRNAPNSNIVPESDKVRMAIERANKKTTISRGRVNEVKTSKLKLGDLVLIHINNYLPSSDGVLQTLASIGIKESVNMFIGDEVYSLKIKEKRNTKHLTLNCPVEAHDLRKTSGKYGIYIENVSQVFADNNLIDTKSVDIVFEGDCKLPEGYTLFVPKEEEEECREIFKTAYVRGYDGNLNEAIIQYMNERNKPVMKFSTSGWCKGNGEKDIENENALANIISENGLPYVEPYWFANSSYMGIERTRSMIECLISIINFLKDTNKKTNMGDVLLNLEVYMAVLCGAQKGLKTIHSPKFTIDGFIKGVYEIFKDNNIQVPEGLYTAIDKDFKGNDKICMNLNMGELYTFKDDGIVYNEINKIAIKPTIRKLGLSEGGDYLYTARQPLNDGSKSPGSLICVKDAKNVIFVIPHWLKTAMEFITQKMLEREGLLEVEERPTETRFSDARIVAGLVDTPPLQIPIEKEKQNTYE